MRVLQSKENALLFRRHVQINNESAIEFYKKFDFEIIETKEHYYKRIEPADAHVLQKTLQTKGVRNGIHSKDGDTGVKI